MRFFVIMFMAIAAVFGGIEGSEKICEPGTRSKVDCNECYCSEDGMSEACTMMLCEPINGIETRVRRQTEEKVCQPGETKMLDCNSCFCLQDGSGWGCTLMGCPENRCEPGTQRKHYCNTCTCAMDGSSEACTRMECPKGVYNEDGSLIHTNQHLGDATLKQKRQVSDDQPCVPGQSFKKYCNTCTCGSDGFSVACTKMGCPEHIFNEDGSLKSPAVVEPLPLVRSRRFLRH